MARVVIGLSGGVDSSVAAYILKQQGHEVIGLFMINWHDTTGTLEGDCPWHDDRVFAELVARKLDIPLHVTDLSEEYRKRVVDYMFAEYERGHTPNPDVLCNREIKFDVFMREAMKLGADYVATGHYCRREVTTDKDGHPVYKLLAGSDPNKDQSYFLCQLSQEQLGKALFPVGDLLKPEVRRIATEQGLATAKRKDSQGICFVGKVDLPLIGIATDPEVTATTVQLMYKHDVLPNEYKNTIAGVSMNYMEAVVSQMLNERLMAYAMKPNAPFLQAGAYDGSFMGIAKTKEAFSFIAVCKNGGAIPALKALVAEAQKVKQFGFTQSEYERAKKSLITSYENSYKERAKRTNGSYIEEYKSFYLDGGYIPGIEYEYNMMQQLAANIPLDVVNQYAAGLITDNNIAIGITGPKKDDITYPTEAEVEKIFEEACKAKVEPYKEEVSDEKLLDKEPKGGKIVSEKKNQKYDVTELTLSNGIKVYLKKTDFKDDTIIMSAEKKGGKSLYGPKDFTNLKVLGEVMDLGGLGKFDAIALQKALTGRTASTSCSVSLHKDLVSGSSSVADFETMLQLLYLESTARRADKDAFDAFMQRKEVALKNAANNPMSALQDSIPVLLYNSNPRVTPLTLSDLKDVNYDRIMQIARERFANYEGAKFFFIGNIDEATMKPLIAKYIGGLAVDKKHPNVTNEKVQIAMAEGQKDLFFKKDFDTPISYILDVVPCKLPYTQKNAILMDVLGAILSQVYTATIREEEGGAYSVGAYAALQSDPKGEAFIQVFFPTDPEKAEAMNKLVYKAINDIAKDGPNKEYLKKTLLNNAKVHEENQRKNGYWLGQMINYYVDGLDWVSDYDKVMKEITPEAVQNLVKDILKQGNKLQMRVTSFKTEKDLKK